MPRLYQNEAPDMARFALCRMVRLVLCAPGRQQLSGDVADLVIDCVRAIRDLDVFEEREADEPVEKG